MFSLSQCKLFKQNPSHSIAAKSARAQLQDAACNGGWWTVDTSPMVWCYFVEVVGSRKCLVWSLFAPYINRYIYIIYIYMYSIFISTYKMLLTYYI